MGGQGKFFMDGADPRMEWQGYIPNEHNPSTLNPERGFVSSANQHPTDQTYPYYVFDNSYEHYRNRRLNGKLTEMSAITVDDMKALQFDDYYTLASEALPVLMNLLADSTIIDPKGREYLAELKSWDFYADPNQKAPTLFHIWWDETFQHIWKEWKDFGAPVVKPNYFRTVELLTSDSVGIVFDLKKTEQVEKAKDHVKAGFDRMLEKMKKWETEEGDYAWAAYKKTSIQHLVPQFSSFSVKNVYTGGGSGILNATSGRMERVGGLW
ncbi:peptidase S45 penicillin amidase [Daphnia sinensis]|uniref:Peptidase S45 penicillin amidase n=1 Tax=Daphnia sinensis TaxID=1820382 RepID=A0AAD5PLY3_9CRUS|nr:peptidase S45 penicillin amidase [Daphnia sinensis]